MLTSPLIIVMGERIHALHWINKHCTWLYKRGLFLCLYHACEGGAEVVCSVAPPPPLQHAHHRCCLWRCDITANVSFAQAFAMCMCVLFVSTLTCVMVRFILLVWLYSEYFSCAINSWGPIEITRLYSWWFSIYLPIHRYIWFNSAVNLWWSIYMTKR